MRRRIAILGSTGSIGRAALEVVAALGDSVQVVGLAAGSRVTELAEQAAQFDVAAVSIADVESEAALRRACGNGTAVFAGEHGAAELVEQTDADFVLAAIVGAAGLAPTMAAVRRGIDVGLANKESLVIAGNLLVPMARKSGCQLVPVDSEHSAVFQAIHSGKLHEVRKIYLTASGGPFRTWPRERVENASVEEALAHPTWEMGPKVTIDSATMMNKALEIIEARHLFGLSVDQIEVLIHPESIVHSMVEFQDGSTIAQLGAADMKTPIQYAMTYPERRPGVSQKLDWSTVGRLRFEPPDFDRFPALRLGFESARTGGTSGAVLNAANEAAVEKFRQGGMPFGEIPRILQRVCDQHRSIEDPTLEQLLEADAWARDEVFACC